MIQSHIWERIILFKFVVLFRLKNSWKTEGEMEAVSHREKPWKQKKRQKWIRVFLSEVKKQSGPRLMSTLRSDSPLFQKCQKSDFVLKHHSCTEVGEGSRGGVFIWKMRGPWGWIFQVFSWQISMISFWVYFGNFHIWDVGQFQLSLNFSGHELFGGGHCLLSYNFSKVHAFLILISTSQFLKNKIFPLKMFLI